MQVAVTADFLARAPRIYRQDDRWNAPLGGMTCW